MKRISCAKKLGCMILTGVMVFVAGCSGSVETAPEADNSQQDAPEVLDVDNEAEPAEEKETIWVVSKTTEYDGAGNSNDYVEFTYDEAGNRIVTQYYWEGKADNRFEWEYGENGKLSRSSMINNGEVVSVNEYDSYGNMIHNVDYHVPGEITGTEDRTLTTDENGNVLTMYSKSVQYVFEPDENGVYVATGDEYKFEDNVAYEYDANNELLHEYHLYEGEVTWGTRYERDAEGKLLKSFTYNLNSGEEVLSSWTDYEYDDAGNEKKSTYYYISMEGKETLNGYTESEYDENNNRIKSSYYGSDGALTGYSVLEYIQLEVLKK